MSYYSDPADLNPFDPGALVPEGVFRASPRLLKNLRTSQVLVFSFGILCLLAAFVTAIFPLATNKSTIQTGLEYNSFALAQGLLTASVFGFAGAGLLNYGGKINKFLEHANSDQFVELLKAYRLMWKLLWISTALTALMTFLQLALSFSMGSS